MPPENTVDGVVQQQASPADKRSDLGERLLRKAQELRQERPAPQIRRGRRWTQADIEALDAQVFEEAIEKIKEYHQRTGKVPILGLDARQLVGGKLLHRLNGGRYKGQGVFDFDDVLLKAGIETGSNRERWACKEGLEEGIRIVQKFAAEHHKNPPGRWDVRKLGLGKLISYIDAGFFENDGVTSLPGLVARAHLMVGNIPHGEGKGFWSSIEGFNEGVRQIREFVKTHSEPPSRTTMPWMKVFISNLDAHAYTGMGIRSYNDLLRSLGFKPEMKKKDWITDEGFDEAVRRTVSFYKQQGYRPSEKEAREKLEIGSFISAVCGGRFSKIGAGTYDGFLDYVDMVFWNSNDGYATASDRIRNFNIINRRAPTVEECNISLGLTEFLELLDHGAFKQKGAMNFDGFIKSLYLPKIKMGFWSSDAGLEEGVKAIQRFAARNGRPPTTGEAVGELKLQGLLAAISKGRFDALGVTSFTPLIKHAGLEPTMKQWRYWGTDEGYERACKTIRDFHRKNGRAPWVTELRDELGLGTFVLYQIWSGGLRSKGITSYADLLKTLGLPIARMPLRFWETEQGLNEAVARVNKFDQEKGYTPTIQETHHELQLGGFLRNVYLGKFAKYHIKSYPAFLTYAGQPIYKQSMGLWRRKEGLVKGAKLIKEFFDKNQRVPTAKEIHSVLHIGALLSNIYWLKLKRFGVLNYFDLLKYAGVPLPERNPFYTTKEGLAEGVKKLQEFDRQRGKPPLEREARELLKLGPLISAVQRGLFKDLGVGKYSQLLLYGGMRAKPKHRNHWGTDAGFDEAIKKMKEFAAANGRPPRFVEIQHELHLSGFSRHLYMGTFKQKGVENYNELLASLGYKAGIGKKGDWKTKKGLDRGVQILKEFKAKNGRAPFWVEAAALPGINALVCQIREGNHQGLKNYHDLLKLAGLAEPVRETWLSESRFRAGIEKIREFSVKNNRAPKGHEIAKELKLEGLLRAVNAGAFASEGIHNLADLVSYSGVLPVGTMGFWKTSKAYEEATRRVKEFDQKNHRPPTHVEAKKELGLDNFVRWLHAGVFKARGVTGYTTFLKNIGLEPGYIGRGFWLTEEGLNYGLAKVREFTQKQGRPPRHTEAGEELGLGGLLNQIKAGVFKEQKVTNYLEFIQKATGIVINHGKWRTEVGLKEGAMKVVDFIKENRRPPNSREMQKEIGLSGLMFSISRGVFQAQGVTSPAGFIEYAQRLSEQK